MSDYDPNEWYSWYGTPPEQSSPASVGGSNPADISAGVVGSFDPATIKESILVAIPEDSSLYDMVANYNYSTGSAAAAGRVSQLPSPVGSEAAKDEGGGFFDQLKSGLNDAYKKDPLKFLQFALQAGAGLYGAQQARELADKKIQADKELVDQKYANEQAAKDVYTNSLRGFGANRQRQPAKKLTRIGGAQVFDANGNYIRS